MDCCNYAPPYYEGYAAAAPPTPTAPHQPYQPLYESYDQRPLYHHQQQRAYAAYHQHAVHHQQHQMHYQHHQQLPHPDYLYGGKEARSRRTLRDRERDRERLRPPPYHPQRWSSGLEYGEETHQYMPECDPGPANWNYYQGTPWVGDRNAYMARQYPSQAYHHPPPTQIPHHQQAYRQDPLRGMAAMQAAHTSPMGEKMPASSMDEMSAMAANCCYTGGSCSCGGCVPQMSHHHPAASVPMNDNALRHRNQPAPAKLRAKDDMRAAGGDRPRKNKSPKISVKHEETNAAAAAPTPNDAAATRVVESVPLPAFQQAFGSTEIGKFSGAFLRTDSDADGDKSITEEMVRDAIWNQLGEGLGDEWREPSMVQLDACFEALPPGPSPAWNPTPTPTAAHHIY